MIVDAKVLTEPRTWNVSKVNRISPNGLTRITLAQDKFDQHKDYIELDENGNVVAMWADYFNEAVTPKSVSQIESPSVYSTITYSGAKPELKIGGSYKKFTVAFYKDNQEVALERGMWKYFLDDADASNLLTILTSSDSSDVEDNQIKIKFLGGDEYIGKTLRIEYESTSGVKSSIDVGLVGL